VKKAPHIVGGQDATRGQWPWQVSLRNAANRHFCGGVIINSNWVLTAAHCVDGNSAGGLRVVVGEHDTRESNNANRQTYMVTQIVSHPEYDFWAQFDADIALLQIASPIAMGPGVAAACKPATSDFVGQSAVVSGWGTLTSGGGSLPPVLQWVELPIPSNEDCYWSMWPADITDGMICAGNIPEYERDSCQGDSGGPMVVQGNDGSWAVVGLVSWGFGCASGTPGVYARVSYYNDWIDSVIA